MTVSVAVVVSVLLSGFNPTPGLLLAQTPNDQIDTQDGKTYSGKILDETARGYLFQSEGGATTLIEYGKVKAIRRGGARAQPAPAPAPPPVPPPEPIGAPEPMPTYDRSMERPYASSAEDYNDRRDLSDVWGKRDVHRMSKPVLLNELEYLKDNRPGIGVGIFKLALGGAALITWFIFRMGAVG